MFLKHEFCFSIDRCKWAEFEISRDYYQGQLSWSKKVFCDEVNHFLTAVSRFCLSLFIASVITDFVFVFGLQTFTNLYVNCVFILSYCELSD